MKVLSLNGVRSLNHRARLISNQFIVRRKEKRFARNNTTDQRWKLCLHSFLQICHGLANPSEISQNTPKRKRKPYEIFFFLVARPPHQISQQPLHFAKTHAASLLRPWVTSSEPARRATKQSIFLQWIFQTFYRCSWKELDLHWLDPLMYHNKLIYSCVSYCTLSRKTNCLL